MDQNQYNTNFIADLHCDLLCYLAGNPKHSPYDPIVRCSIPQLQQGNVKIQVLAIFTESTRGSTEKGTAQMLAFKDLLSQEAIQPFTKANLLTSNKILVLPAIENASAFCDEHEPLENGLSRFKEWQISHGPFAYVSLTWNGENRFGGGAHTKIGLKDDGKHLIEYLAEERIPIDFSHTSDELAYDVLNHIEKRNLSVSIMASHSNARAVRDVPRNLPDDLIKEIFHRKGIIGLNFYKEFVCGNLDNQYAFSDHLEHYLSLGGEDHICFGADFFFDGDLPLEYRKKDASLFLPGYDNASCYSLLLKQWETKKGIPPQILKKIAINNFLSFLKII